MEHFVNIIDLQKYKDFIDINAPYTNVYNCNTTGLLCACKILIPIQAVESTCNKHIEVVKLLLLNGANPNMDAENENPLLQAIFKNWYYNHCAQHVVNILKQSLNSKMMLMYQTIPTIVAVDVAQIQDHDTPNVVNTNPNTNPNTNSNTNKLESKTEESE